MVLAEHRHHLEAEMGKSIHHAESNRETNGNPKRCECVNTVSEQFHNLYMSVDEMCNSFP